MRMGQGAAFCCGPKRLTAAQEELNDRKVEVLLDAAEFLTLSNHNNEEP